MAHPSMPIPMPYESIKKESGEDSAEEKSGLSKTKKKKKATKKKEEIKSCVPYHLQY